MAHAKPDDLKDISELLQKIRTLDLREKTSGCFYRKSKGVLHFHKVAERRYAHAFNGNDWEEIEVPQGLSIRQQSMIFESIKKVLCGKMLK